MILSLFFTSPRQTGNNKLGNKLKNIMLLIMVLIAPNVFSRKVQNFRQTANCSKWNGCRQEMRLLTLF